jgi:hypothetical protein
MPPRRRRPISCLLHNRITEYLNKFSGEKRGIEQPGGARIVGRRDGGERGRGIAKGGLGRGLGGSEDSVVWGWKCDKNRLDGHQ